MSKYMQMTIHVRSFYPKDIGASFPRWSRYLRQVDSAWVDRNPSLFEIAGRLDKLLYASEGTGLRKVLLKHEGALRRLYKAIEEKIANWRLAEADRLLYELEDLFELMEEDLDKMGFAQPGG